MAITKRPNRTTKNDESAADRFISGAPDAAAASPQGPQKIGGFKHGKRQQFTVTLPPEILQRVDATATRLGTSRNALITLGVNHILEQYEQRNG